VRTWPAQAMPGFPPDYLSDREIDLVIGYLKHMAGRKQPQ
jgi:mono/diheme cytochrome c family protein